MQEICRSELQRRFQKVLEKGSLKSLLLVRNLYQPSTKLGLEPVSIVHYTRPGQYQAAHLKLINYTTPCKLVSISSPPPKSSKKLHCNSYAGGRRGAGAQEGVGEHGLRSVACVQVFSFVECQMEESRQKYCQEAKYQ